jgi:hypothetical protein
MSKSNKPSGARDLSDHQADWAVYPTMIDDSPAFILADLGWAESHPDLTRTTWLHVRFPFTEQTEDGLPAPETMDQVEAIEESLITPIESALNAVHVGSMSHQGFRHVFFYAPTDRGLADAVRIAAGQYPKNIPSGISREDPDWDLYGDVLWPEGWSMEFVLNARVCSNLLDAGDDAEQARPIDHLAYFSNPNSRGEFESWLKDNDYQVVDLNERSKEDDDSDDEEFNPFAIEFVHTGPADPYELSNRSWDLREKAASLGGEYDGWATEPVKAE